MFDKMNYKNRFDGKGEIYAKARPNMPRDFLIT